MGGGVALRVLATSWGVRSAVRYGAMCGDEQQYFEQIYEWSDGQEGLTELQTPLEALVRISPIYYLERITAAVSIHHGTVDDTVPPEWSDELCQRLQGLGKRVECFTYRGQGHTFTGEGNRLFVERAIDFFSRH
jgi:dipeptidyl aminopeptidase/acylaminoacyl peptidase